MRLSPLPICIVLCTVVLSRGVHAQAADVDELKALSLADTVGEAKPVQPWRVYLEGAAGSRTFGDPYARGGTGRVSLDARFDANVFPGVRAVFSSRLDLVHDNVDPSARSVNTLRELYLSWARTDQQLFDIGRVNVRHGSAVGFNPTDWFKENALRAVVSADPAVLRENRQGSVVLRGQQLWSSGSVTATFSPKLGRSTDSGTFALNAGATNPRNRWLVASSYKVSQGLTPELLLHGGGGMPTQVGLNVSALAGESTVVFGEVSAGRGRSLRAQSLDLPGGETGQRRAALGATFTTGFNLSFTVEAEYNSAAPDGSEWLAIGGAHPSARLALLNTASALQDLPARRAWFVYVKWQDAFVRRLDLSGFVRFETATNSRAQWLEARYRWDRTDLALQWIRYSGDPGSIYGMIPQRRAIELVIRRYL